MNRNWIISQYCENPSRYDLSHCEDACAAYADGEISVMALCSGAETASLSHIGAACIAEFSVNYFAEHFDQIFEAEFNVACEELIKYHQATISKLAEVALAKKNVQILVGRNIQIRELNKFSSSVQLLAIKGDRAIYFKVGNGSAVIAPGSGIFTLSDSVVHESSMYITIPNPVNLLIGCDFKTFTLSPACQAIALATDGVEFESGLFHNHAATPFYEKVIMDIADSDRNADLELQELANALLCDNMNASKDNIGISIMHRKPLEEAPVMEAAEEPVAEEIEVEIVEEPVAEEIEVEIVEEPVAEEIEVEIVEEPVAEEIEVEIVEEPAAEEIEVEIVEESVAEEIETEIVEEPIAEEIEAEIIEEPAAEEIEVEVVDDPVEESVATESTEDSGEEVLEEVEIEIIDDEEDVVADTAQKSESSSEQPQEKKISRTILKFFNVSIKKK